MRRGAFALLVVMTVMTGLSLLLASWWQAAGWAGDLVLVRQQAISRFYLTEVVLNYGVAWVKKEFKSVAATLASAPDRPVVMDGGVVNLGSNVVGKCTVTIEALADKNPDVVRVAATIFVDGRGTRPLVTCHRCLVERQEVTRDRKKEQRFVVHHWSIL